MKFQPKICKNNVKICKQKHLACINTVMRFKKFNFYFEGNTNYDFLGELFNMNAFNFLNNMNINLLFH